MFKEILNRQLDCLSGENSESGQSMTEYIILVILVSLVMIPMVELLPEAIQGYARPFYYSVSRPIP